MLKVLLCVFCCWVTVLSQGERRTRALKTPSPTASSSSYRHSPRSSPPEGDSTLNETACQSIADGYPIEGAFTELTLQPGGYSDELWSRGEESTTTMKCSVRKNSCYPSAKELLQNVTLMNGTHELHGIVGKKVYRDEYILFHITLDYANHYENNFRCFSKVNEGLTLMSRSNHLDIVEKIYVDLIPHVQTVIYGANYTLTCKCNSCLSKTRLGDIRWYRRKMDGVDNYLRSVNCDQEKTWCKEEGNSRVLTIQSDVDFKTSGFEYFCKGDNGHSGNPKAIATVHLQERRSNNRIQRYTAGSHSNGVQRDNGPNSAIIN